MTAVSPVWARMNARPTVMVNGTVFEGPTAMIGWRPYVGVESFADAMDLPHIHDVKCWQLAKVQSGSMNPLKLEVLGPSGQPLPTVRRAGVTMVDLMAACHSLNVPFHYGFSTRTFEVGTPYRGQRIKGAWYRWLSHRWGWYQAPLWDINPANSAYTMSPRWPKGIKQRL